MANITKIKKSKATGKQIKYKVFDTSRKAGETDEKYFKRLAKVADQRLVRLEGYKHDKGFRNVEKWAYANAMNDLKTIFGQTGKMRRFNKQLPTNKDGSINKTKYDARINALKRFLESETSTKQGIINVYKRKADSLNSLYGTEFTWEDLATYFNQGIRDKAEQYGASKTVLRAIGKIQKMDKEVIASIKANKGKDLRIDKDEIVDETIKKLLQANDIDLTKLL